MSHAIADEIGAMIRARFQIPDDDPLFDFDVHLFEEGYVDSQGVVELIAKLEQTYAVHLPSDVLFSERFTTVRGIAGMVVELREHALQEPQDADQAALRPVLVELSAGPDSTPLLGVYGLYVFKTLAQRLAGVCPFQGVYVPVEAQARAEAAASGGTPLLPSVEEVARGHLELIRARQPLGPYRLVGTSFGGLVAYEVAQQLVAQGEEVEILALLDTVLPRSIQVAPTRWVAKHLREFARQGPRYVQQGLRRRLGHAPAPAPVAPSAIDVREHGDPVRRAMYAHAISDYEPRMRPYAGKVVLYRADHDNEFPGYTHASDLGWGHYASQLSVIDVPDATHVSIPESPEVAESLGALLAPLLDRASGF